MPRTGRDEAPHGAGQEESMENAGQDPAGQQAQADPQQAAADPQQAQGGSEGKDYKALYEDAVKESRKWEKRSKESGVPDIRRDGCNRGDRKNGRGPRFLTRVRVHNRFLPYRDG